MRPAAIPLGLALALALGAGCAKGPLPGRLSIPGQPDQPVTLSYESGVLGGTGKLWTTLPGGESYKGEYRLDPRNPERQMTGTLTSPTGGSMLCHFRLKEPGIGPDGGGTYRCQLSTGGIMEGSF